MFLIKICVKKFIKKIKKKFIQFPISQRNFVLNSDLCLKASFLWVTVFSLWVTNYLSYLRTILDEVRQSELTFF